MKKYIGLDLGTVTLGIAKSDALGFVHQVETFRFPKTQYVLARKRVYELCEELEITDNVSNIYISTNHTGLYEKYGFEFYQMMNDIHGEPSRVYVKRISDD